MTEDAIGQTPLADDHDKRLRQALTMRDAGRLADAAQVCMEVLAQGYVGFNGVYLLGTLYYQLKQYPRAAEMINLAIALRPDFAAAYSNRGLALRALNQNEKALADFDRAIALQPDYIEAHANRALALHSLGRPEEAVAAHERATALGQRRADPGDA